MRPQRPGRFSGTPALASMSVPSHDAGTYCAVKALQFANAIDPTPATLAGIPSDVSTSPPW